MENVLGKVTAFVTREGKNGTELLLFKHPHAGIQIPAGTIEEGESPKNAAIREIFEETGLEAVDIKAYIGFMETQLPEDTLAITEKTAVYSRPDSTSFDWAHFRHGILVKLDREQSDFLQVTYEEGDSFPDPSYITYKITGWVPVECMAKKVRRYFYHITYNCYSEDRWERLADNHSFELFWAPMSKLPNIVFPQSQWLDYVRHELNYDI